VSVDLAILGKLADLCRDKGIKSMAWGDVKLELGIRDVEMKDKPKSEDPDVCKCGHSLSAHVNGLCVLGPCEPDKCTGDAK
jgi:hypothetical protein